MSGVGRKHGRGADDIIAEAQAMKGPEWTQQRAAAIDGLPVVIWKGRTLRTVTCRGTSGRGPHPCNLPLAMLWHLITLDRFYCPYHAGDAWGLEA